MIPTLAMGGAERVVAVLSGALARQGQDVWVLKYFEKDNEYPVDEGVKVKYLLEGGEVSYRQTGVIRRIRLLRERIREIKPDFVLPFLFQVAQAVFFATIGLKTNVFQSIRISPSVAPASKTKRFFRDFLKVFFQAKKSAFTGYSSQTSRWKARTSLPCSSSSG